MDPFENLDRIDEDTSCSLIQECLKRKYDVYYLQIKDLELRKNQPWAKVCQIKKREGEKVILDKPQKIKLDTLQAIFIRKDPPFDLDYLYSTYILENVHSALLINHPRGLRDANKKLYILNFPELIPESLVTKNPEEVKKFLFKIDKPCILKPLNKCSGKEVIYLKKDDINLNSLLEMATREGNRFVIIQEYLPQVREEGDKRILLLEGKALGAMRRIPPPGDYRANIHRGARYTQAEISRRDLKICQKISPRLAEDGIYFAGLDIIGEKLVEINVTSPAGIPEINRLTGKTLEKTVIDWVEEKIKKRA